MLGWSAGVRTAVGMAKREAMSRDVDPRHAAAALIQRYGYDAAAAFAVDRITELHEEGDLYGLSVWREIRKAIADLTREGELSDDG